MKTIILLVLTLFTIKTYAQESVLDLIKISKSQKLQVNYPPQSNIENAGFYLQKSAKLQYAAIGVSIVSIGTIVSSTLINDKYEINTHTGVVEKKNSTVKTSLLIVGATTFVAAVCCELVSINYKLRAGRYLQMRAKGTEGSIALIF
ncbi:hypothetical protein [uncultured Bacteroides sp.]|uniref:hypothetical protein n=1 Tax=uncultured Bacteroides sp. TaxID=162156 RepID=UPI002676A020|nr:hypothetical protein [uncultured Bacteroides sp.]